MRPSKLFLLLAFLLLSTASLFSQSYLIAPNVATNTYPITFTDNNQKTLIVEFDRTITAAGTATGWSVTVGGVGVALSGPPTILSSTTLRIILSSSISYSNRNTVLVSYNAVLGSMSLTGPVEPNFTNASAINNWVPIKADFSSDVYGEKAPFDICAAVKDVEIEYNILITQRIRNSINYTTPIVYLTWVEGNDATKSQKNFIENAPAGSGTYKVIVYMTDGPFGMPAGYPDNTTNCTWKLSMFPYMAIVYNGSYVFANDNPIIINLPNYKLDNGTPPSATGKLGLDPPVDDIRTLFCVGSDITNFKFTDATVFDCQLAVEADRPNIYPRYVQYVYGTQVGAGIPNVFINVNGTPVQVTDNSGASITGSWYVNPDGTANIPGYTTPSGFFEGPVVQYLWDNITKLRITPLAQTYIISHSGDFVNDAAGDIFDVTLRNWGPCNQWLGDYYSSGAPVTEFSRLRLIPSPPLPTASNVPVCLPAVGTLTATRNGTDPAGVLHWYNNSDLLLIHEVGTGGSYSPGALIAGTYNYWVREIVTGGCEGPAKQVVLTINGIPTASAGGTQTICQTGTATVSGASSTNGTIAWTENGAGSITAGATTLTPTYTAAAGDAGTTVTLTMTVSNAPCTAATATYTVIVQALPTATAGGTQTICQNGTATVSGATATNGTIAWTENGSGTITAGATTLTPTYTAAAGDAGLTRTLTMTVTSNNTCNPATATATYTVIVKALPTASAGGTQTICQTGTATVSGASSTNGTIAWTENGAGSITAGATTLTPTYTAAAGDAGTTVTLTMTGSNAPCTAATATYTVIVQALPTATAGGTQTICQNGTATVSGASRTNGTILWTENGAGTITAGSTTLAPTYTAAAGDAGNTVTLTMTVTSNNACNPATATATYSVVVDGLPTATAGGTQTICQNGTATVSGASSTNGTIAWTENGSGSITAGATTLTPTYTAAAGDAGLTRTLTMTVTSSNTCNPATATATYTVIVKATPTATISGTTAVCLNSAAPNITFTNAMALAVTVTYNINGGASLTINITASSSATVAAPTGTAGVFVYNLVNVFYQVAPTCTNTLVGSATVTVNALPVPTITGPASACIGSTGNVYTTEAGMSNYLWVVSAGGTKTAGGGVGNNTVTVTWNTAGARTVSVNYTDGNGCTAVSPTVYNVAVGTAPATATLTSSGDACFGSSTWINSVITGGGPVYIVNYTRNGVAQPVINPYTSNTNYDLGGLAVGTYTIAITSVSDLCGGFVPAMPAAVVVNVKPIPTATISSTTTVCQSAAAPNITFTNPQAYPVTITFNINGGANTTVNVGASTTANVAAPTGTAGTFVYNLVNVFYQSAPGCTTVIAGSATVTVRPTPTATISGTTIVCQLAASPNVTFTNPMALPVTITYNINGGANTTINVGATTTATVAAPTAASGVFAYSVVNVFYQAAPTCSNVIAGAATITVTPTVGTPTVPAPATTTICQGSAPTAYTTSATDATSYNWSITGAGNSISGSGITGTVTWGAAFTGVATISVTANGCNGPSASSSTTVTVNPTPTATISGTTTVCQSGAAPTITFTNAMILPVTVTYNINGGANTTINVAGSSTNTLAAPTGTAGTFIYNLINVFYQAAPACTNALAGSATVTVRPTPTATISGTTTVCQSAAAPNITFTNPQVLPITVTYNINGGGNTTVNVGASTTATVAAPTGVAGTFAYNLVSVDYQTAPTCTNAVVGSATVTVRPTPTATISGTTTVCQLAASPNVTFTNPMALPVTVTYNINAGANTTVNVAASSTATVAAPTGTSGVFAYNLVNVFYQAAPSCTNALAGAATITVTQTVAVPVFALGASSIRCQAAGVVTYSATATNTTGITYTLDAPSLAGGNTINGLAGDVTYAGTWSGTTTITASAAGCNGPKTSVHVVTVNSLPAISAITGDPLLCNTATNKVYQVVNHGATSSYAWTVPGAILTKTFDANLYFILVDATGTGTGNIQVTETITATGCSASATPFNVTVSPVFPGVLVSGPLTVCQGASGVHYSVPNNVGSAYSWIVPPGASITSAPALNDIQVTFGASGGSVSVFETTAGGCLTVHTGITVTVNPTPSITNMNSTICSGGTFTAAPANGTNGTVPAGTTYSWAAPSVTGGVTGGATGTASANISGTLINPTSTFQSSIYTVTPVTGTCTGLPFTVTVLVNPMPAVNNIATTICSAGSFSTTPVDVTNGTVPSGTTYTWAAPSVTGGITGGTAGTNAAAIAGTLINPTNSVATATYTVTPRAGTCTGATFTVTVTVDPKPSVNNMSSTICSAGSFTAAPLNGVNGIVPVPTTYTWSAPSVTGGLLGGTPGTSAADISGTLTNPTNTTQIAIYTVTPTSGGCAGSDFTVTITVNPMPAITDMVGTACSGVSFTAAPSNGVDGVVPVSTTYSWGLPAITGGLTASATGTNAANISGLLSNPTNIPQTATYTVTPKSGSCTGATFTVTITVDPKPAITNLTATICSTGSFTAIPVNGTDGIVPVGTTYTWAAPAVSGGILGGAAGTNAANISGSLTNPTNISQTAIYTVTPKSGSCTGLPFTVTVTVDPKPAIANMTATICSGESFTSLPADGTNGVVPAGTTYIWAAPAITGGITGGLPGTAAANISGTLTNPTNIVQTATYTVTPISGGCTGANFTVTVTVNPMPAVNNLTTTICSAGGFVISPVNLTDGIIPSGTTYSWLAPGVTGGVTGGAAGTNAANISGTLINPTNVSQTATYTVTPKSGGCTGATFTVTVTVDPKATITPMTATICSGSGFTALPADGVNGVVPAGTTYSWSAPTVSGGITGGAAGTAAVNITGTLTNPTNSAQTAIYSVTPTTGTCTGTSFTVTVTVNPMPAVTDMTAVVCSDGTFTKVPADGINGVVPAGTTYTWAAPAVTGLMTGGAAGTAAASISGMLNNPTNIPQTATYTVFPTSGTCNGASFMVTVTVNPKPTITNMVSTICSGGSFVSAPLDGTNGVVPAGTTYSWLAPAITGGLTGGAAGTGVPNISGTLSNPTNTIQTATYTVTPTSGSCTGATFTVTVAVDPKPSITNMTAVICSGGTFASTPVNTTNGIVPVTTNYTWGAPTVTGGLTGGLAGSGASIGGTLINPSNSAQIAIYTVTPVAGGCTGNDFTVTVTVNPVPAISNMTSTACSTGTFTSGPANGTDGVVPSGTTYTWLAPSVTGGITGGAAGTAANISGTLVNPTNTVQTAIYTVTPTSGSCAGADFTVTVTVNPKPAITNMTALVCSASGFTATPSNGVNGLVPATTTYTWPAPAVTGGLTGGSAGVAASNISGTFTNPTNAVQEAVYTVTPTAGGCTGANFTITVTVDPTPAINPMTATTCSGAAFTSTPANVTNGIVPGGTTYTWGIPSVTGGITGGAAGAGASITGALVNPTNTTQTVTYTVTPVSGACTGATFTVTVTVNPLPTVSAMTATTCSGGTFTSTPVNVTDGIVPVGTTYTWTAPSVTGGLTGGFAGGGANITGTLTNPTNAAGTATYTVTPISGSCTGATFTMTVTVNPKPAITNMIATICSTGTFTSSPTDPTDGIVPAGTTYTWAAPAVTGGITGGAAGTAAADISGTLTNPTNAVQTAVYTVTPTSGSCTGSTFTVTVTVNPNSSINDLTATICSAGTFSATPANITNGIVPAGTTYTWGAAVVTGGVTGGTGGSGTSITGTLINPTNTAQTATYTVTPLSGTCTGATFTVTVTVNPKPGITNMTSLICSGGSFIAVPANGTDGVVPTGTTYTWPAPAVTGGITGGATGTGAVNINGTLSNPTNTLQTATYTVTPVSGGCTGTTFTVIVTVDPKPAVTSMSAIICSTGSFTTTPVDLTNGVVPAGTTYAWAAPTVTGGLTGGIAGSGGTITGTLANPTNAPQIAIYTVTPTAGGCTGTAFTVTVTVNPAPAINAITAAICSAGSFISNPVNGTDGIVPAGTTYTWTVPAMTGGLTGGVAGSGASINGTLTNPTNVLQTATYTVTPASGSCAGPIFTVTVTVDPKPAIIAITQIICSGGSFTSAPADGTNGIVPAGTTYTWAVPVVTGGLTGGTSGTAAASISGTLTNPTNAAQTATYTVTPTTGGCTGANFTVTVTVNPMPNVSNMTAAICSGGTFASTPSNITNGVVPVGTTYNWAVPVVTGGITGGVAGSGAGIGGTLTNPTNTAQTATYTVTPVSGSCTGTTFTVTITVNPMPAVTAMIATICSGTAFTSTPVNVTNGLVPAGTTYTWPAPSVTGGLIGGVSGTGAANISGTLTNTTTSVQTATYTVTPASGSCTGATFTVTITVNPSTGATSFTAGATVVCQDAVDETYTATATNSTSIAYSVLPASAGVIDPATGVMNWDVAFSGTATITATSTGLCGTTTANRSVTVNANTAISVDPVNKTTCEFGLVSFNVTATGANLVYSWEVDQNTGTFIPVIAGSTYFGEASSALQIWTATRDMNNYKYRVVVTGCPPAVTSTSAVLTVNTSPELSKHPSDSTVCLGGNATMEADGTGTSLAWIWEVNKGSGFIPVVADAHFSGVTTKTLVITNALITYNNWIFRAKVIGVCGVPTYTNFGRLSVINPPVVGQQPVAKVICENGNTTFLANGSGFIGMKWQFSTDNGVTFAPVVDDGTTYVGSGTNQLTILNAPVTLNGNKYRLGLIGSCTTVYTNYVSLTVNTNPVVNFTTVDPIAACGGVPITINGNPAGGITPYTHRWTGDVGPLNNYTVQSPTFTSLIAGTYNLTYKVTDSKGCTATDDVAVIVDSPSATFTQDANNGCTPLTVSFSKDMTGITKFWWDFNDGSPKDSVNANPVHLFTNANATSIEYRNVKLTVRSAGGCLATFTSMVTVYPAISASFTANTNIVCSGNPIIFTAVSGASKYFWDYGDGASGYATNSSNHMYTNFTAAPVVYTVKLRTTSFYSCEDEKTMTVTVMPVPLPQFSAVPPTQVYSASGNPVAFTNETNAGTWSWLWKFGDGATSVTQAPSHTYTALGEYTVTLIVKNANCTDSIKHKVSVTPQAPVALFDSIPSGCQPFAVSINNTSLHTEVPGTTYRWDFGNGYTSNAKNPTYTYFDPGTYRIELTVTGPGGVSVKSQVVNSYPSPKANFNVSPVFVFVNDEKVRCFNLTTGADTYLWEFGDGDTSKMKEPFHKYMEAGIFDVTLWASSNNGCRDKFVLSPGVTVEPAGDVRFSTVFTPNLSGPIDRTDLPTGGTEIDQFFFPPIREKVINYKLQIFNRLGVLIFESRDINIPWNGYYKGKLCSQGVYIWYVEGKYANGQPFKKVGDVTLLH